MPLNNDSIEIFNITVAGCESYSGGGTEIQMIPIMIALGIWHDIVFHTAAFQLIDSYLNQVSPLNTPLGYEAFLGAAYKVLGMKHEPGAALFPISSAYGHDLNIINNNAAASVYRINVTTTDQEATQSLIGNTSVDRELLKAEQVLNKGINPYIGSHQWSQSTIFYPLAGLIKDPLYNKYYFYYDFLNRNDTNNPFNNVSQITRYMSPQTYKGLTINDTALLPEEQEYMPTADLANAPGRDLYHYFFYGFKNGITENSIASVNRSAYGNQSEIMFDENGAVNRGISCLAAADGESKVTMQNAKAMTYLEQMTKIVDFCHLLLQFSTSNRIQYNCSKFIENCPYIYGSSCERGPTFARTIKFDFLSKLSALERRGNTGGGISGG